MFEFMKRLPGENKKEYKKRLKQRGTEIINGINCSDDERINLIALMKCQTEIVKFYGKFIYNGAGITPEEYALRKGTATDYEKYINALYFKYLDFKRFKEEKANLWEELRSKYLDNEMERESPTYFEDKLQERLNQDEQNISRGYQMAYSRRFNIGGK